MNHTHDDDLRARFRALRAGREQMAGSFRVPPTPSVRRRRPLVLAASSAFIVLLAAGVYTTQLSATARERRIVRGAAELMMWRAPSDVLLHNAYAEWLGTTPSLQFELAPSLNSGVMP